MDLNLIKFPFHLPSITDIHSANPTKDHSIINKKDNSTLSEYEIGKVGTSIRASRGQPSFSPMTKSSAEGTQIQGYLKSHRNSKIKPISKKDGEPLWRVDIQYDFLSHIFHNELKVFTNSYNRTSGHTFADIYIDTLARSSTIPRVLSEKLLADRVVGVNIAMLCLLVNMGRISTVLNFFPQMQLQLRTYRSIPSLQAYTKSVDCKHFYDSSRLRNILTNACNDRVEPSTLEELAESNRTNPINLVFLLSTFVKIVEEKFFVDQYEFHDLMNTKLSSKSRSRAFLWLMWTYLESDPSHHSHKRNPFGPGTKDDFGMPSFQELLPDHEILENVDTPNEIEFGEIMAKKRKIYIDTALQLPQDCHITGRNDKSSGNSFKLILQERSREKKDSEIVNQIRVESKVHEKNNETVGVGKLDSPSTSRLRLVLKAPAGIQGSRNKPKTSIVKIKTCSREFKCQIEIQKLLRKEHRKRQRFRYNQGPILREWVKIKDIDPLYDSDNDCFYGNNLHSSWKQERLDLNKNMTTEVSLAVNGSLATQTVEHPEDYGEESSAMAKAFRRSKRWLERWHPVESSELSIKTTVVSKNPLALQMERKQNEELGIEIFLKEKKINSNARKKEEELVEEIDASGMAKGNSINSSEEFASYRTGIKSTRKSKNREFSRIGKSRLLIKLADRRGLM